MFSMGKGKDVDGQSRKCCCRSTVSGSDDCDLAETGQEAGEVKHPSLLHLAYLCFSVAGPEGPIGPLPQFTSLPPSWVALW